MKNTAEEGERIRCHVGKCWCGWENVQVPRAGVPCPHWKELHIFHPERNREPVVAWERAGCAEGMERHSCPFWVKSEPPKRRQSPNPLNWPTAATQPKLYCSQDRGWGCKTAAAVVWSLSHIHSLLLHGLQPARLHGTPRQEHWGGLPLPFPGDLPDSGTEPQSVTLAGGFFTLRHQRSPLSRVHACLPSESLQSGPTLCDPMVCSPAGSSVHGILQARTLEWVAMPTSMGSSRPRDQIRISGVSCIGRWVLYH